MKINNSTTAVQLAEMAHAERPGVHYAPATDGNSVAAWANGRWVPVASRIISGGWVSLPYELLINGKPAFDQALYGATYKETI